MAINRDITGLAPPYPGSIYGSTPELTTLGMGKILKPKDPEGILDTYDAMSKDPFDSFNKWERERAFARDLPMWGQLDSLRRELGDDFEVLAPHMYAQWKEHKAIIDYRKARDLLGAE